jgi:hypothetical protein
MSEKKEDYEMEKTEQRPSSEIFSLLLDFSRMLRKEIEIRNQINEERRMESEQNLYMDQIFMCEFIFSNL